MFYTERQEQAVKHLRAFTAAVGYENALTMRFCWLPENIIGENKPLSS